MTKFNLENLKAQLFLIKETPTGHELIKIITLRRDEYMILPKYNSKDENFSYAISLSTYENLKDLLKKRMFLRLEISATHSLSKTKKMFFKNYTKKNIQEGIFQAGLSTEITQE